MNLTEGLQVSFVPLASHKMNSIVDEKTDKKLVGWGKIWQLRCLYQPLMALHRRGRACLRHRHCGFAPRVNVVSCAVVASSSTARDPTVLARGTDGLAVQAPLVDLRNDRNLAVAGPSYQGISAHPPVFGTRDAWVLTAQGGTFKAGTGGVLGGGSARVLPSDRNEGTSPVAHRLLALTQASVP